VRIVVVFDTNVLLSGLLWQGPPARCLALARSGDVEGITCVQILAELADVLRRKLGQPQSVVDECLADLLSFLSLVQITGELSVVTNDSSDDKILECGVASNASFLVTGDRRHLLPLESFRGMQILRPAKFLERVTGDAQGG
jgi:uncharacterized protein